VTLEICPDDVAAQHGCSDPLLADGRTKTVLRVCTPVAQERRTDLVAKLEASAGRFEHPKQLDDPSKTELAFGVERCADASLVMPTEPGFVRVDADLAGYRQSQWLGVNPAPVSMISLLPVPITLTAGKATFVTVSVQASGPAGAAVTTGTTAAIGLTPTPMGAYTAAQPTKVLLDSSGKGTFSIYASAAVTGLAIAVSVAPPEVSGLTVASPVDATVNLVADTGE
jgi:hypothetical protein